jgi:hypothetical protein
MAMGEYRFLCPTCGQGFMEETSFTRCPRCGTALLKAGAKEPADLARLGEVDVDVDALLRKALAAQQPGEEIDKALARIIEREYPDSQQRLIEVIGSQLDEWLATRKISRQRAAEELARADSQLKLGPEGRAELRTEFRSEIRLDGLEELSPELRDEARKQIADMLASGAPGRNIRLSASIGRRRIGCVAVIVIVTVFALIGLA